MADQQMLGAVGMPTTRQRAEGGSSIETVAVDFVSWFAESFKASDFVVLKMDIEGAEMGLLESMLTHSGAPLSNVDVMLWECHHHKDLGTMAAWGKDKTTRRQWCKRLAERVIRAGVSAIYSEPSPGDAELYKNRSILFEDGSAWLRSTERGRWQSINEGL